MNSSVQDIFEFEPGADTDTAERSGFELGWDHGHHGLVPAAELLLDGTPIGQGWRAAKAVFGQRTLAATRPVRQWLALRTLACRRGLAFETTQLTPHYLSQIEAAYCPVTRQPLGGAAGSACAPVFERLNADAGYAAGHLALISQRAADARAGLNARDALRRAARVDAGIEPAGESLSPAEHWRLAVLLSFVTPLPFAEAARVPLRVLPPNRVRLLNAVQGLQALLTLQFSSPGWSQRLRALADLLPDVAPATCVAGTPRTHGTNPLRHDFNLFVGAIAPRLLEAGAHNDARATRRALEDAWADERVNRRWQQFVLALGENATAKLLERAAALTKGATRTLLHDEHQATEGWALASRGRSPLLATRRRGDARPPQRRASAARADTRADTRADGRADARADAHPAARG